MYTELDIKKYANDLNLESNDIKLIKKAYNGLQKKVSNWAKYSFEKIIESLKICFSNWSFDEKTIIDEKLRTKHFAHELGEKIEYNWYNISYKRKNYNISTSFLKTRTRHKGNKIIDQIDMFVKIENRKNILDAKKYIIMSPDFRNDFRMKVVSAMIWPLIVLFIIFDGSNGWSIYKTAIEPVLTNIWLNPIVGIGTITLAITFIMYLIIEYNLKKDAIVLENREFEKIFDVNSNDPITARQLYNAHTIEQIIDRKEKYWRRISEKILIIENIMCIKYSLLRNKKIQNVDSINKEEKALMILIHIYSLLNAAEKLHTYLDIENMVTKWNIDIQKNLINDTRGYRVKYTPKKDHTS